MFKRVHGKPRPLPRCGTFFSAISSEQGCPPSRHRLVLGSTVTVTHGAQEALFLLFDALLRPGDQVIAFNPGWQPLMGLPPRIGASVTVLPYGPGMSVDAAAVTAAAGENLRLIALNSPCNLPPASGSRRRNCGCWLRWWRSGTPVCSSARST